MSDRGFLFLFSLVMIAGSLAGAGWLVVSGQAGTVDGLFMLLTVLLIALVFVLYLVFLIRRVRASLSAPVEKAKVGATAAASRPTPAAAARS